MARPVTIDNGAILATARRVFLKHGFQVPASRVAREAGVSEGSLFKHFKTKTALFRAAMEVESQEQEWEALLMRSVGEGDMQRTLQDVALRMLRHLQRVMPCVMMVSSSGVTFTRAGGCEDEAPPRRLIRVFVRYFRAEIRAGRMAMASPEIQAHAFVGAISHYVFCEHAFRYRSGSPAAYARTVVETVLRATRIQNP